MLMSSIGLCHCQFPVSSPRSFRRAILKSISYLISPLTAIQAHAKEHKIPLEWHLDNENLDRLDLIARPAEVAIVFISASSGEGYITVEDNFGDRNNMEAWGNGAALVKAVCEVNKNVIVVIHSVSSRVLISNQ